MEMPDDVGADEARRTGDEDGERFEIHAPPRASTCPHQGNETFDVGRRQFVRPESYHTPSGQRRFEVFLQIGSEARPAVVSPVHVDSTFDLYQRPAGQVGEIGPPFADGVKSEFLFQLRPTICPP
jgi:hypothetical protein